MFHYLYCVLHVLLPDCVCCITVHVGEVFEKSYLGTVSNIQLNGYYAAALFEGKIQLHVVRLCTSMMMLQ